jgi:hypothetical protein
MATGNGMAAGVVRSGLGLPLLLRRIFSTRRTKLREVTKRPFEINATTLAQSTIKHHFSNFTHVTHLSCAAYNVVGSLFLPTFTAL